jgi:hypothetical protein
MKKQYAFMCFLVIYIGLFCFLGLYTFPQADDYSIANMVNRYGFWQAQVQWHLNWPVSPVYQVLVSLVTLSNFKIYNSLQFVTCLVNICALYGVLHITIKNLDRNLKILIVLLMQAVWLAVMTGLNENFYWMDAIGYTWGGTLLLFTSALMIAVLKKRAPDVKLIVACSVLLFIAGEFGPQIGLFLCGALFCLFCICIFERKKSASIYLLSSLCIALAGFLAFYLSPGLHNRTGGVIVAPSGQILQTLKVASVFGCVTALKFFASPTIYVLLLYMPLVAKTMSPFNTRVTASLRVQHLFFAVAFVSVFNQAIHGFALGTPLPPRAEGLTIWLMLAVWLFLWVFCYRDETLFAKIKKLRIYPWRNGILILCLILSPNFISLVRDMRLAPLYAQEMKERYASTERQKREGKKEIFLPTLRHKPVPIFYRDLTLSPHSDQNESYGNYWGVNAVVAYPHVLTPNDENFSSLQNVIERLKMAEDDGDPEILFKLGEVYDAIFPIMGDVSKDNSLAAQYYLQAARLGYAPAQSRLIRVYATGAGVPRNYFYALEWLLRFLFNGN